MCLPQYFLVFFFFQSLRHILFDCTMIFLRALLGLSIASQAYAFTYYLHESCEGKITEDVITEVKKMAEEGGNRLRDDNDKVMADAFKRIFRVDRSPEAEGFTTATSKHPCRLITR